MAEEEGTITEAGDTSQPVPVQSGDLISTVDMVAPIPVEKSSEETQKTEETEGSDKEQGKTDEQAAADVKAADTDRFDKHPRFQELITGNRDLKARLAKQAEQIEALQKPQKKEPAYKDVGAMTNEEIQEWQEEKPQEYAQNLAMQIESEVREKVLSEVQEARMAEQEATERKSIEATYGKYAKDHSDFNAMWDSGELEAYMGENPGTNAMNAHEALTKEATMQTAIDEAVAKALKDAETKVDKSQKAKKGAQVLDSGPSSTGHTANQIPAELKDTKKFGGMTAVLAARSLARSNAASP